MDQKSQKIFDGDFTPGFRIELHIKDLQNVMDTSHQVNVSVPFSSLAMEIMQFSQGSRPREGRPLRYR